MAYYQTFPTAGWPPALAASELAAILPVTAALRQTDPTAALVSLDVGAGIATVKSDDPWTDARVSETQALLDGLPDPTPADAAVRAVDALPVELRAVVLALVDQINVVRAATAPLAPLAPDDVWGAIRSTAIALASGEPEPEPPC